MTKSSFKKSYTTHQVSQFFDVYPTTVIKWIKDGLLPAFTTPGGHRRIKDKDILKLMKKNNTPVPDELLRKGKYRVLAIDDEPKILRMIDTVLSAEDDLEIRTTMSGFDAGLIVSNWSPDIILLDFLMPEIDGFEVCVKLKSDEKTRDIPIIAVTVLKEEEELKKIRSVGTIDYIHKPFKSEELVKKIRNHLNIE